MLRTVVLLTFGLAAYLLSQSPAAMEALFRNAPMAAGHNAGLAAAAHPPRTVAYRPWP